jgi:flagellin
MGISLTAGMRSNLINLQQTAKLMDTTAVRLNSGKKVNSALDDPISFFTAKSHMSRAANLGTLKNGMSEAIQTITASDTGISSMIALIEAAKSKAESAKSAGNETASQYATSAITVSDVVAGDEITIGGEVFIATTAASAGAVGKEGFKIEATDELTALSLANAITSGTTLAAMAVTGVSGATVSLEKSGADITTDLITTTDTTFTEVLTAGTGSTGFTYGTVDVASVEAGDEITIGGEVFIATTAASAGAVGKEGFKIEATDELTALSLFNAVTSGATAAGLSATEVTGSKVTIVDTTADMDADSITTTASTFSEALVAQTANQSERDSLADQFQTLMTQIGQMQNDSGYKGVNLLDSEDILSVKFEGSNKLEVVGFDGTLSGLGLYAKAGADTDDWSSDALIDADITRMNAAIDTLEEKASSLASSLSIVTTRQDFTSNMINTLTAGADNLTLADMNEEGANMLMLQTQQALGTSALSMSAQTAQGVLRLF